MLLAVPAIMLIAASMLAAFKSCIFVSAICCKSAFEIVATVSFNELPAPFWILQAFFNNTAAGGVFVTKLNSCPGKQ